MISSVVAVLTASFEISEILILGCGRYIEPVSPELQRFIRSTGMKLEAIDSVYFIVTFFSSLTSFFLALCWSGHVVFGFI